ncbi:hypothetical protein Ae168Ps1_6451 [Pseudonocardia sp. Ae168_Ps1]|nr:hypothetical protein Ae168Ps1_6451 [Pseudonocardia sp. Ae168_Ps1]
MRATACAFGVTSGLVSIGSVLKPRGSPRLRVTTTAHSRGGSSSVIQLTGASSLSTSRNRPRRWSR